MYVCMYVCMYVSLCMYLYVCIYLSMYDVESCERPINQNNKGNMWSPYWDRDRVLKI